MLAEVKVALRVTSNAFDSEITALIDAARSELKLSGIRADKAESATDVLICRAIILYAKANFGYDNTEAERFQESFESLRSHLSLAGDYREL